MLNQQVRAHLLARLLLRPDRQHPLARRAPGRMPRPQTIRRRRRLFVRCSSPHSGRRSMPMHPPRSMRCWRWLPALGIPSCSRPLGDPDWSAKVSKNQKPGRRSHVGFVQFGGCFARILTIGRLPMTGWHGRWSNRPGPLSGCCSM